MTPNTLKLLASKNEEDVILGICYASNEINDNLELEKFLRKHVIEGHDIDLYYKERDINVRVLPSLEYRISVYSYETCYNRNGIKITEI